MDETRDKDGSGRQASGDRAERLAEALRANLGRRKAQARARRAAPPGEPPPEGDGDDGQDTG